MNFSADTAKDIVDGTALMGCSMSDDTPKAPPAQQPASYAAASPWDDMTGDKTMSPSVPWTWGCDQTWASWKQATYVGGDVPMDSSPDWGEASPPKDPSRPTDTDALWDIVPPPPANSPPRGVTKSKDDFNIDKLINAHNAKPDNDDDGKTFNMSNKDNVKTEHDALVKVDSGPMIKSEPGTLLKAEPHTDVKIEPDTDIKDNYDDNDMKIDYDNQATHHALQEPFRRPPADRRARRNDAVIIWDSISRVVRQRRKWDQDARYRAKMASDGWVREVRTGQRTSCGAWVPHPRHTDITSRLTTRAWRCLGGGPHGALVVSSLQC